MGSGADCRVDLKIKVFEVRLGGIGEELTYRNTLDEVFVHGGHEAIVAGLLSARDVTRGRGRGTISLSLWFRLRRFASSARRRWFSAAMISWKLGVGLDPVKLKGRVGGT
jgi:hypothetical protein